MGSIKITSKEYMNGRSRVHLTQYNLSASMQKSLGHFPSFLWFSFSVTPTGISSNYLFSFPLNPCRGNKRYTVFDNESHRSASCLLYLAKHLYKAQQFLFSGAQYSTLSLGLEGQQNDKCCYLHLVNISDLKICSFFQALIVPFQLCSAILLLCGDITPSNSMNKLIQPILFTLTTKSLKNSLLSLSFVVAFFFFFLLSSKSHIWIISKSFWFYLQKTPDFYPCITLSKT